MRIMRYGSCPLKPAVKANFWKPISARAAHRYFYEKAHFVKGQRGGLRKRQLEISQSPFALRFYSL
jgi:hypothetical protein